MTMIKNQVEKIMKSSIKRRSEILGLKANNVQLVIFAADTETPGYYFCANYKPQTNDEGKRMNLTFGQMYGKVDFMNFGQLSAPYIMGCLKELADKYDSDISEVEVMVLTNNENADQIALIPYVKKVQKQQITLYDILGELAGEKQT